jgi:hypothetical protein
VFGACTSSAMGIQARLGAICSTDRGCIAPRPVVLPKGAGSLFNLERETEQ